MRYLYILLAIVLLGACNATLNSYDKCRIDVRAKIEGDSFLTKESVNSARNIDKRASEIAKCK